MSTLRSVTEHQDLIASLLAERAPGTESVELADAAGRVLATPVVAGEPLPGFDNSAMDGYAVRAVDIAGASPDAGVLLPVLGDVAAGDMAPDLAPGTALRIMTGAPLPSGADAVVEVEATDGGTTVVHVQGARPVGSFVRPTGSDVAVGQEVLPAGAFLGPAAIGLLAALGESSVAVRRRPRVLVCSTGSELAERPRPGSGSGQIRDANGPMLAAAVEDAGGDAVHRLVVSDDVGAFRDLLDEQIALLSPDLVITSGGVSAGAYEVVKLALADEGIEFTKVAMQPGMPQGTGVYDATPVVCLPGNPVSALVSFEVFVRPALRAWAGAPVPHRPVTQAVLTESLTPLAAKRQFRRARLDRTTGTVQPWGPPGSGFLGWFAGANALIDLPAGDAPVPVGDTVDVWDLLG